MKILVALLVIAPGLSLAAPNAGPKTDDDKTFYALGLVLGRNLAAFELKSAELRWVTLGLKDQVQGAVPKADIAVYGPKIEVLAQARRSAKASGEKKRSEAFLAKMAAEKGAVKTGSGLVFIPMKEGTGPSPRAADTVKAHYHGTLIDGTVFDSSVQRGQPMDFSLGGVIACWTEGLQKMKVGGKAKLVCPSQIAYGDRGSPPVIPAGATLMFEVELLDIVKKQK